MPITPTLTERQREVFEELVGNKPTKVIASDLGISEYCLKWHIYRIYRICGVNSRYELIYRHFVGQNNTLVLSILLFILLSIIVKHKWL